MRLAEHVRGTIVRGLEPVVASAVRQSFLGGVSAHVIDSLLGGARLREIRAGHVFISSDEPPRCGILVEGLARVYRLLPSGAAVTMRRVGPGAAVGIRAMLARRNDVNVVAVTDCLFLPLDPAQLARLAQQNASLAWAIAEELTRRLDDTQLQAESALAGTVLQKICGALLDLSVEGQPLHVELSQEDLAESVGASREAVGRELRRIAAAGLIATRRARIDVLDPLGLESLARSRSNHRGRRPRVTP